MKTPINLVVLALLAAAGAQASVISITLDNPNQVAAPGQTLSFTGTVTNTDTVLTDAPIFFNGDDPTLFLGDASFNDDFFANFPIELAPGETSGPIDLFDVTLANPGTEPFGTVLGGSSVTYQGGADGGLGTASDTQAVVNFQITVAPEPGTLALLGAGLVLAFGLRRLSWERANR